MMVIYNIENVQKMVSPKFVIPPDSTNPNQGWINPILGGNSWTGDQQGIGIHIFYSFDNSEDYLNTATREILATISNITKLTFEEKSSVDGIIFMRKDFPTLLGQASPIFTEEFIFRGSDVQISSVNLPNASDFARGGGGYDTLVHEIGHALGLGHPDVDGRSPFAPAFATQYQNFDYSIMVSTSPDFGPITSQYGRTTTPQFADIAALQYLYGANTSYNSGNTTYKFTSGDVFTLWDGGGIDIIDASAETSSVTLNLNEADGEAYSTIGATAFWIASGASIENASGGSAGDTITGNNLANIMRGYNGNDSITGGAGNDHINGNRNNDTVSGGNGNDTVFGGKNDDLVYGGNGNDLVNGNRGRDTVIGEAGHDIIHGGKDNDVLYGQSGNDSLYGDLGNDLLYGDVGADIFIFNALNSGVDTIADFTSGADKIQLLNSSFATPSDAVLAFSNGVLDLGGGNTITLTGISSLIASDIII